PPGAGKSRPRCRSGGGAVSRCSRAVTRREHKDKQTHDGRHRVRPGETKGRYTMATFLTKKHISRRTLLRSGAVGVGLPFLEAMVPAGVALAQVDAMPKKRAGFFYLPHGTIMNNTPFGAEVDQWTSSG